MFFLGSIFIFNANRGMEQITQEQTFDVRENGQWKLFVNLY